MNLFYEFERLGYGGTGTYLFIILGSEEGGGNVYPPTPPPPHPRPLADPLPSILLLITHSK